jgi:hypothetical protein
MRDMKPVLRKHGPITLTEQAATHIITTDVRNDVNWTRRGLMKLLSIDFVKINSKVLAFAKLALPDSSTGRSSETHDHEGSVFTSGPLATFTSLTTGIGKLQHFFCFPSPKGQIRNAYVVLVGKPRDHQTGSNIRMDLRKQGGKVWSGFIWLRIGSSGGLL